MKNRTILLFAAVTCLAGSTSAKAQGKFEVAPFAGYETSGSFPVQNSLTVNRVRANAGVSYGTYLDYSFAERAQVEFMWNRNNTSYFTRNINTRLYAKAFNSDIDQYHFGVLYMFRGGEQKLRPYIATGIGFTHDSNSGRTKNRTEFSFGVGGGVKYYVNRHFGLRGDARWVPTYANSSPGVYCDPFGFCYTANLPNYLNRGNFTGGIIFRF